MSELVIIGKRLPEGRRGMTTIEYPSVTGSRTCRIPNEAILKQEDLGGSRTAVLVKDFGTFKPHIYFGGPLAPEYPTTEYMQIAMDMEAGIPLTEQEYNDEVPTADFGGAVVMEVNAPAELTDDNVPWMVALRGGGRGSKVCNWKFNPVRKPAFVFIDEGEGGMGPTAAPVNDANGKPAAYHLFNPDFADAKRPMGAHLGTFSDSYYAMPFEVGYEHFIKQAKENGWKASVTAFNEGKVARLDCDVSQAGHTLEATKQKLLDAPHKYLDHEVRTGALAGLEQLYRYGFTIHNSLDGSSAFRIQSTAMRMVCSNLMTMGRSRNIFSLRHGKTLRDADLAGIASQMNNVLVEAQEQLMNVELMKSISATDDMLDQIMTLSEKHGLISRPKIVKDDRGNVTDISRGHMWKVMTQGWTSNPDWVNVDKEDEGSLFKIYNILTGALTHRPTYNELNKAPLTGSALNLNTLNQRLGKAHEMCTTIAESALTAFAKHNDGPINIDSIGDVSGFVLDNGIPVLEGVPLYSDVMYS